MESTPPAEGSLARAKINDVSTVVRLRERTAPSRKPRSDAATTTIASGSSATPPPSPRLTISVADRRRPQQAVVFMEHVQPYAIKLQRRQTSQTETE